MASDTPSSPTDTGSIPETNSTSTTDANTYYTWSTFFRLLTYQGTPEERRGYFAARDLKNEDRDCKRCEEYRDWLFQKSPIIRFMREQINELGPNNDINSSNVRCRRCTTSQQGGFDRNYGILLCANELNDRSKIEDCMAHEMVHAYDHVRFKVDPDNMRHQACTEIRASMLSGECRFTREFFGRQQFSVVRQLQECVRRRATLSLMARRGIRDRGHAESVVDSVWESCFGDTRPFDYIYR
jgi:mitochondrial inner membrane protease ATP23